MNFWRFRYIIPKRGKADRIRFLKRGGRVFIFGGTAEEALKFPIRKTWRVERVEIISSGPVQIEESSRTILELRAHKGGKWICDGQLHGTPDGSLAYNMWRRNGKLLEFRVFNKQSQLVQIVLCDQRCKYSVGTGMGIINYQPRVG